MKRSETIYWLARVIASFIMLQTLYFKFTASEESVFIFTAAGIEPWGRILVGVLELIASLLMLIPSTVWAGSFLALGLMAGAIVIHLTLLGIEVKGDGGQLFIYALIVVACAIFSLIRSRSQLPEFIRRWLPSILFK